MKCELIFYLAGRTGQLEELLEERIAELQEVLLMLDCRIEECAALPA